MYLNFFCSSTGNKTEDMCSNYTVRTNPVVSVLDQQEAAKSTRPTKHQLTSLFFLPSVSLSLVLDRVFSACVCRIFAPPLFFFKEQLDRSDDLSLNPWKSLQLIFLGVSSGESSKTVSISIYLSVYLSSSFSGIYKHNKTNNHFATLGYLFIYLLLI